jgi:hypothetical protein
MNSDDEIVLAINSEDKEGLNQQNKNTVIVSKSMK